MDNATVPIDEKHVDRRPHADRIHCLRREDNHPRTGPEDFLSEKPHNPTQAGFNHADAIA